jgi:hypothetical protein
MKSLSECKEDLVMWIKRSPYYSISHLVDIDLNGKSYHFNKLKSLGIEQLAEEIIEDMRCQQILESNTNLDYGF